jgi:hypothetical protein
MSRIHIANDHVDVLVYGTRAVDLYPDVITSEADAFGIILFYDDIE